MSLSDSFKELPYSKTLILFVLVNIRLFSLASRMVTAFLSDRLYCQQKPIFGIWTLKLLFRDSSRLLTKSFSKIQSAKALYGLVTLLMPLWSYSTRLFKAGLYGIDLACLTHLMLHLVILPKLAAVSTTLHTPCSTIRLLKHNHARTIVESRWAIAITVRPTESFSNDSWINRSDTESSALVASSKIKMSGLRSKARASLYADVDLQIAGLPALPVGFQNHQVDFG